MKKIIGVLVLGMAVSTQANLITNGDFSSGDLSGWTVDAFMGRVAEEHFEGYDNGAGWATLSQNISTTAGQLYEISFMTKATQIWYNDFAWSIDEGELNSIATTSSWVTNTATFTATDVTTDVVLSFSTAESTGVWNVDNVSVTAIPEPATFAFMATFGICVLAVRRIFMM